MSPPPVSNPASAHSITGMIDNPLSPMSEEHAASSPSLRRESREDLNPKKSRFKRDSSPSMERKNTDSKSGSIVNGTFKTEPKHESVHDTYPSSMKVERGLSIDSTEPSDPNAGGD